jgi:hypothetical protein
MTNHGHWLKWMLSGAGLGVILFSGWNVGYDLGNNGLQPVFEIMLVWLVTILLHVVSGLWIWTALIGGVCGFICFQLPRTTLPQYRIVALFIILNGLAGIWCWADIPLPPGVWSPAF